MDSLIQKNRPVRIISPAAISSATTGDYISLKNTDGILIHMPTGAITTGGNVVIKEAKDVSGTSAQTLAFGTYYKMAASTDTLVKTSADTASSADCITVADADDNAHFFVELRAAQLTASFDCITVVVPAAVSAAALAVSGFFLDSRYKGANQPSALVD